MKNAEINSSPAVWFWIALAAAVALPPLLALFSPPALDLRQLFQKGEATGEAFIFLQLRLPRHVLAFCVGAALSLAGASFQSLLKNPLADPYILGVSGGAAFGYVLAVVTGLPFVFMPLAGFGAALFSLIVIYRLASSRGTLHTTNLLLTGVIFNSFSFALILIMNAIASFGQSQQILFLLLGSVESVPWGQLTIVALLIAIALIVLLRRSRELNLLSLGDEEAFHLGVDVTREKTIIFVTTSLLVGASVAVCGLIGFVGLFVPHLMRLFFGADHRRLLPACLLGGGLFLLLSDFAAGHILMWESLETRLPVGVVTALVGAPLFVFLLKRQSLGREADHA